jgi:hypothetical protein
MSTKVAITLRVMKSRRLDHVVFIRRTTSRQCWQHRGERDNLNQFLPLEMVTHGGSSAAFLLDYVACTRGRVALPTRRVDRRKIRIVAHYRYIMPWRFRCAVPPSQATREDQVPEVSLGKYTGPYQP